MTSLESTPSMGQSNPPNYSLVALYFIAFVSFLDTFAMLPILSPFIEDLGASGAEIGFLIGLYSLTNLMGNLFSGYLLDRWGRKWPMVISLYTAAVLIALYGVIESTFHLGWVRGLHGLTGAIFIPAMFAVICESRDLDRRRAMGRTGAVIGLVALLGPPLGGIVSSRFGVEYLFYLIAGLMALAGVVGQVGVREVYRPLEVKNTGHPTDILVQPRLQAVYLATLAFTYIMGVLVFRFPLMMRDAGYSAKTTGVMLGLFALVASIVMSLCRKGDPMVRALGGVAVMMVSLLCLGLSDQLPVVGVILAVYGLGFGLAFPSIHLLAYEWAPSHLRGTSLSLLHGFYSLGFVLGPLSAGILWAYQGYAVFDGSVVILLLGLAWWRRRLATLASGR